MKLIQLVFYILIAESTFAQTQYIDKIREAWLIEDDKTAISIIDSLEKVSMNEGDVILVAQYYKGIILFSEGSYQDAKQCFERILSSSNSLLTNYDPALKRYFTAPQLLHNSASYMSDIEFELSNFNKALLYQKQADYKYPQSLKSTFSQGIEFNRLYSATRYAACYSALGIGDSVLIVLVPIIIEDTGYSYEALVELKKYYKGSRELLEVFDESTITIRKQDGMPEVRIEHLNLGIKLRDEGLSEAEAIGKYTSKLFWARSFIQ